MSAVILSLLQTFHLQQLLCPQVSSSSSIPGSVEMTSTSLLKISKSPCSKLRKIPRCPELLEIFKAKPVSLPVHSFRPSPSPSPSLKVKPVKNESTSPNVQDNRWLQMFLTNSGDKKQRMNPKSGNSASPPPPARSSLDRQIQTTEKRCERSSSKKSSSRKLPLSFSCVRFAINFFIINF